MRSQPSFCLLVALSLLLSGCWGESAASRMLKQAKARGDVAKEKEAKAAAMAGGFSPDNAAAGGAALPGSIGPATSVPASAAPASANKHVAPAAVTAPAKVLAINATVEQRRARTMENLAKLGRALNAYADGYAGYPATKVPGAAANPPMSWRVAILPLLGYESLFKQYRPAEPWDSTSNKKVLAQIPVEFQSPERRDTKTNYLVPLGAEAAFGCGRRLNAGMFEDGPDYTLIVVEADDADALEWTRPDDLVVQGAPLKSKFGSLRGDGFFAVLGSGQVCRIKPDSDELALKALFTTSGSDSELIKDAIQEATAVPVPPPEPVATTTAANPPAVAVPGKASAVPSAATTVPQPAKVPFDDDGPAATTAPSASPLARKKLPVPRESELAAARSALKELYAQDYKEATSPQARGDLAKKLVNSSQEVGEDHAAAYELLRIARDLAAQNGELKEALRTVEQLERRFEIDAPAMRLETLKLFQKSPEALAKSSDLASHAEKLVQEAIGSDEYEVAEEALKIEKGAAKRAADQERLSRAARTESWIAAASKAHDDFAKATVRLEASPGDAQANQIVGSYECLVKGRWEQGLPQLAKATDLKLRFLAKLDLSSSKTPQEMFDLANQYWDLAEQKPDLEQQGLKLRSAYWYSQATRELADGLDKIKARKRLAEITKTYGKEETAKATGSREIAAMAIPGGAAEE